MSTANDIVETMESPVAPQTEQFIDAFESSEMEQEDELILAEDTDPRLLANSLWHAVYVGNAPLVRELLNMPRVTLKTDKEPMLMMALQQQDAEMALMLINAGADVNESDYLHTVITSQDPRMQLLAVPLIDHGADVEGRDARGRSVISCAIQHGSLALLQELLIRGVEIPDDEDEESYILRLAAINSKASGVLEMLYNYGYINFDTRHSLSLLAIANNIQYGPDYANLAEVKKLLDQGVTSVDETDSAGFTALHCAVSWSRCKIAELLLAHGADVNKKTRNGTTPLMLALGGQLCETSAATLLIRHGANINDCNDEFRYPIHVACEHGFSPNIRLLICMGAKTDVKDHLNRTPFMLLRTNYNAKSEIFLKHFAFQTTKGIPLNAADLAAIRSDQYRINTYNQCLVELQIMKKNLFMTGVTYFDIINGKIDKLSLLTKNDQIVRQFYEHHRDATGKSFPWLKLYYTELKTAFQMAEKRRDMLITKEELVQDAFKGVLPQVALDNISRILLLDDLINFKKDFYLSLFSK